MRPTAVQFDYSIRSWEREAFVFGILIYFYVGNEGFWKCSLFESLRGPTRQLAIDIISTPFNLWLTTGLHADFLLVAIIIVLSFLALMRHSRMSGTLWPKVLPQKRFVFSIFLSITYNEFRCFSGNHITTVQILQLTCQTIKIDFTCGVLFSVYIALFSLNKFFYFFYIFPSG